MKKILLIITLQLAVTSMFSQIRHSINLEYNLGYYFDNRAIKKNTFFSFPRPPALNYQLFYKNWGTEASYKFIEPIYYKTNSSKLMPDSVLTSRQTAILNLGLLRKFNIFKRKFFYTPKLGGAYIIATDYSHLGYRNTGGTLIEPVNDSKRTNSFALNLGSKIETTFLFKVNTYIGLNYFSNFTNQIQNKIITFDIGCGYILNRKKK